MEVWRWEGGEKLTRLGIYVAVAQKGSRIRLRLNLIPGVFVLSISGDIKTDDAPYVKTQGTAKN